MLRYLACLIGVFGMIAVLPARAESQAGGAELNRLVGLVGGLIGGVLFLVFLGSLIAWQWRKTSQVKDDDKALEELRIIYGFWLIVGALLIALLVLIITLTAIPINTATATKATDIVAIAGTVTGLITTLTAAFFGIQQAGAGRSQALTALAQGGRAAGAVVGKLDPSYGPHSGGTKLTITGNGFTGVSGVNFGATPGTNFKFENDGLVTVNSPPAQSKDNEAKVYVVFPSTSPPNSEVGTFYYYTIEPSHGPAAGGQGVTIIGSGLKDVSAVKFGEKDGANLGPLTPDPSGRESRAVTAPAGSPGSDVPIKLVFPVDTGNKISVIGTYHYDDGSSPALAENGEPGAPPVNVVITPNPLTRATTPQQIRIGGQNLGAVKSVRLSSPQGNPVHATNVSATANAITCDVLISDPVGDWDLHLFDDINATGTVTDFANALTVQNPS